MLEDLRKIEKLTFHFLCRFLREATLHTEWHFRNTNHKRGKEREESAFESADRDDAYYRQRDRTEKCQHSTPCRKIIIRTTSLFFLLTR